MESKVLVATTPWYKSKMVWLGIIQIALDVSNFLLTADLTGQRPGILVLSGVLTIVLRYLTKTPLTVSGQEAKPAPAPTPQATRLHEMGEELNGSSER